MPVVLFASMLAAVDASPTCRGTTLPAAVARYARLSGAMDARRVAAMFALEGVLVGPGGAPISGPGEVERFLGGFGAYKLADYVMTVKATMRVEDGWRTAGTYSQRGTDPAGVAFSANGRFAADWRCTRVGWRVTRMRTASGE